ncbi:hypothetical protein XENOCAPTIV_022477 [Xenoophorus captivus]|uniref:Uncharacterized protein n=1 Tax=Xenoophorus captivus TaxID=1517983 RepID=A0ABV0RLG1_9TELE
MILRIYCNSLFSYILLNDVHCMLSLSVLLNAGNLRFFILVSNFSQSELMHSDTGASVSNKSDCTILTNHHSWSFSFWTIHSFVKDFVSGFISLVYGSQLLL